MSIPTALSVTIVKMLLPLNNAAMSRDCHCDKIAIFRSMDFCKPQRGRGEEPASHP